MRDSVVTYEKVKQPDGTYVEEKRYVSRKFGNVLKACFVCTKSKTCTATKLDECKFEKPDNVVLCNELKERSKYERK